MPPMQSLSQVRGLANELAAAGGFPGVAGVPPSKRAAFIDELRGADPKMAAMSALEIRQALAEMWAETNETIGHAGAPPAAEYLGASSVRSLEGTPTATLLAARAGAATVNIERLNKHQFKYQFMNDLEVELKKTPQAKRDAVKVVGLMYLSHDASDLVKLDKMVDDAAMQGRRYSGSTKERFAKEVALGVLQDRSGEGDARLVSYDFASSTVSDDLTKKIGRKIEANMADPDLLLDLVVMYQRCFKNAQINPYLNGHSRSGMGGILADEHDGGKGELASGAKHYPDDIMSFTALAARARTLEADYGVRLGSLGVISCGSGCLESISAFLPKNGAAAGVAYLAVSEEVNEGASIAWMDSLSSRTSYDAKKVAVAMAETTFKDGSKPDPAHEDARHAEVKAVLKMSEAKAFFAATLDFSKQATSLVAAYPKAFADARNTAQRMVGTGSVDFSGQVDVYDFIEKCMANVERDATNPGDARVKAMLEAGRRALAQFDRFVVQKFVPTAEVWGERQWESCPLKNAHGLAFWYPGVTKGEDGKTVKSHVTGRFRDLKSDAELRHELPDYDAHGLTALARAIEVEAVKARL